MCERFTVPERVVAEREFMPAHGWWNFAETFNVSASQYVPAIRQHAGQSEGVMMHWGLIPSWTLDQPPTPGTLSIAHNDLIQDKASRGPWLGGQRCIVPVSGFYAWQLTPDRYRQPYFIRLADRAVFGLAAIWDRWEGQDEDVIESCCLIHVAANELIKGIAHIDKRMPAILRRKDYSRWLQGTPVQAMEALKPYEARRMQAHAVSPRINSPALNDLSLIRPAGRAG